MYGNKIEKRIEVEAFLSIIAKYETSQINCTEHTFFRLNEKQRKIYSSDELIRIVKKEIPVFAGIQYNGNYAIIYKRKDKNMKIILGVENRKINIVTFYFIYESQIPKL